MSSESLYLVDAYNVIRRVNRLRQVESRKGLEAGRDALVSEVLASGVLRRLKVVLVFDGSGETGSSPAGPHPRLSIHYSRPPENADAAICRLLSEAGRPERVTVVTADHELAWEVSRLGGAVQAPDKWEVVRRRDFARRKRAPQAQASEKPVATSADVAWGLSVFGDESIEIPSTNRKRPK